jgi:hypothetical protein
MCLRIASSAINRVGSGKRPGSTAPNSRSRNAHRAPQRHQRMLQGDDLVEPGPEQVLPSRLAPFRWPHLAPRQNMQRRVNHKSNLQGIPFCRPYSRQTQMTPAGDSRFQINDLGIFHVGHGIVRQLFGRPVLNSAGTHAGSIERLIRFFEPVSPAL